MKYRAGRNKTRKLKKFLKAYETAHARNYFCADYGYYLKLKAGKA